MDRRCQVEGIWCEKCMDAGMGKDCAQAADAQDDARDGGLAFPCLEEHARSVRCRRYLKSYCLEPPWCKDTKDIAVRHITTL